MAVFRARASAPSEVDSCHRGDSARTRGSRQTSIGLHGRRLRRRSRRLSGRSRTRAGCAGCLFECKLYCAALRARQSAQNAGSRADRSALEPRRRGRVGSGHGRVRPQRPGRPHLRARVRRERGVRVGESLKVPAHVWKATLEGLLEAVPAAATGTIVAPTLIVWGDRDVFVPREDQQRLTAAIRNSRLVIHEGVGHVVHWEQPERVAADIEAFLDLLR